MEKQNKTILFTFGPTIAAFFLTFLNEGKKGVLELLKRGFSFKFKKIWLIPVVLLLAIFGLVVILAQSQALAPFIYSLF